MNITPYSANYTVNRKHSNQRPKKLFRLLASIVVLLAACNTNMHVNCETFTIGYMTNMHGRTNTQKQGVVISGAISYALDVVNSNASFLGGHKLRMIYNDTQGDTLLGTYTTIHQWHEGAIAFFGPEDSCAVEATVASSLNLPMISYKCSDSRVSDKHFYKTFARTNPSDILVVRSLLVLLRYYRWSKFSVISEGNNPYMSVAQSLEKQVSNNTNFTINHGGIIYFPNVLVCCEDKKPCCRDNLFSEVVEDTYKSTRVYVFFGRIVELIELMTKLEMRKLLDTREYVIIYIDLEAYSESASYRYFWRMDMRQPVVKSALKAASHLLVIVPTPPQGKGYSDFVENVRQYNFKEPFNFPYLPNLPYRKHITEFAAYLYDSVILYAEALAQTLGENGDPRNGSSIIQKIIKRGRYQSVTGTWMHIDENGDVEGNYTVLALQPAPQNLTLKGMGVGGERNLSHLMLPMARFLYDGETGEPVFSLLDADFMWEAPLDEPPCGFDGTGCFDPPSLYREFTSGILSCLFLIITVGAWVMYRNWKYEQEIEGLLWRISEEDIQRYGSCGVLSAASKASLKSTVSLESRVTSDQAFTQIASYKGTLVATKALNFKNRCIDIPRETKKEMKTLRELHHDNINPFIGACVKPHYILLVTGYCAKGSLKNILANTDIKLDEKFIASLVFDLIKGMIFLHDSDLKFHGNLKSTNCVVTSRWALQITDFGLRDMRIAAEETMIYHGRFAKLLWTAPELLRSTSVLAKGTQKGDIYSFAIILHEIISRKEPFGEVNISPEEIIKRVKDGADKATGKFFRPNVQTIQIQDYVLQTMTDCWSENPEQRPEFRHVRERLKKMKEGLKTNIMDLMITMMESYADNLEHVVAERTAQLQEEQRKTEALLHRMLPKSVAEQLMTGSDVSPESFECVTIYFSDIVGFTEMSATSTPMEVVAFLNDLYTVFDEIIGNYDVYKVETIGDAYMVVSGLPIRNGDQHAAEVASMALDLLEGVQNFEIRHKPNQSLLIRIGIHSGPVVAGVVGLTMPRYCLFGDTVNTASRMESNGQPLKIHISNECRRILESLGGYEIQSRGLIKLKGKGEMETYWLVGHELLERKKPIHKGTAQPPALFNLLESESRRRSPKTEFHKRVTASNSHRSLDDATVLLNGPLPKPKYLRVAQDSPQAKKRHSATPTSPREAPQPETFEVNDPSCNGAFNPDSLERPHDLLLDNTQSNADKIEVSPTECRAPETDTDVANQSGMDDVTKPLIRETRRLEHLKTFKKMYQPWRRSWSADVIDQSASSKPTFVKYFCNIPRSPVGKGNLHTLKESEKEESVV